MSYFPCRTSNHIALWPCRLGFFLVVIVLTACASPLTSPAATPSPPPAGLLADVLTRGTLVIATDPAYPPQSELKAGAVRAANTKCAANQQTASEFTGFDIDVAVEIAHRLGVEPCFVTPTWTQLISGNWADRWDISVGSVAITQERLGVLYFTQPYYVTPAAFFVYQTNTTFSQPSDLSGKKVGVCAGCTYEAYLQQSLALPGQKIDFVVKNAVIVGYDIEISALQDLAVGDGVKLDAVLTGVPVGQAMLEQGLPVKQVSPPLFSEYLAAAVDKKSSQDPVALVQKVSDIIQQLHGDGTLLKLSQQYYGLDLTTPASKFDLKILEQFP